MSPIVGPIVSMIVSPIVSMIVSPIVSPIVSLIVSPLWVHCECGCLSVSAGVCLCVSGFLVNKAVWLQKPSGYTGRLVTQTVWLLL